MKFGNRQQGVVTPVGQLRDSSVRVEPGKVLNVCPVTYLAVEYGNEYGVAVKEIWLQVGEDFWRADDAEAFTAGLRLVKATHANQVAARLAALQARDAALPKADVVDVISKQTAAEATNSPVDV